MELVILWALTWAIVRGLRDTVANTSALLHGEPVHIDRHTAAAPVGHPVPAAGRPSYVGRSVGTVAAVMKESLAEGTRQGWSQGRQRYQARRDRRTATRQPTGRRTQTGVDDAPILDTTQATESGSPTQPDTPAAGKASGPDTRALLDDALITLGLDATGTPRPTGQAGPGPVAPATAPTLAAQFTTAGATTPAGHTTPEVSKATTDTSSATAGHPANDTSEYGDVKPMPDENATDPPIRGLYAVPNPPGTRPDHTDTDTEATKDTGPDPATTPTVAEPPSSATPQGGPTVTTMTGETTSIDATRTYFGQLAEHVQSQILSQLELCQATLAGADMDPATLGHLTSAMEQFAVAKASVEAALASLNSRHALMEEAVNTTEHAAQRDYYRHQ